MQEGRKEGVMEDVEGLMRGLKLSTTEKKGVKIGEAEKGKEVDWGADDPQAVGNCSRRNLPMQVLWDKP